MKKIFLTLLLVLFAFQFSYSQDGNNAWSKYGPNMGRIFCGVINPVNQSIMYVAGLDSGIYKTTNGGLNWTAVNNGLVYKKVQCLAIAPSSTEILYAGTDSLGGANSGVYKTTNGGNNWTLVIGGLTEFAVQTLVVHTTNPNTVWACIFNAIGPAAVGLWKTTNGGTNWFASNTGIASDNKNVLAMAINPLNPNVLYVGTSLILPGSTGPSKIYKTYDGGANWNLMSTGLPTLTTDNNPVRCIDVVKSDTSKVGAALFVNAVTGGFFLSTNGGQSWTRKHDGLPAATGSLLRSLNMRSANEYYVGMDGGTTTKGVWRTTNGGNNWVEFNNNAMSNLHPVRMLLFKTSGDTTLYAGASGTVDSLKGVYGYTWPGTPTFQLPDLIYYKFEYNPSPTSTPNFAVPGVGSNPATLTTLTLTSGGQFDSCLSGTATASAKIATGYNLSTGTSSFTISMWLSNLVTPATTRYLFGDPGHSFRCFVGGVAPVGGAILRGTGVTDVPINNIFPGPTVVHIVYDSSTTSISVYKNGVLDNTVAQPGPLNFTAGTGFSVGGYSTSAGLEGIMDEFRFYKRALNQAEITATWNLDLGIITGITPIKSQIPENYSLSQNYPNPFNPVTKINFALPKSGLVSLRVYDVLGREIATLVNEVKNAGVYSVDFNASNLTSGTYFYRLESNGFVGTKKMLMIK